MSLWLPEKKIQRAPAYVLGNGFLGGGGVAAPEARSLRTDGVDEYVSTVGASTLLPGGAITKFAISLWFFANGAHAGGFDAICGATQSDNWDSDFGIYFLDAQQIQPWYKSYTHGAAWNTGVGAGNYANRWVHLVMSFDGTVTNGFVIYGDGVAKVTTDRNGDSFTPTSSILNFGRLFSNSYNLNGYMRNMALWNTSLSSSDVTTLYNGGVAGNMALSVKPANLRLFLPINANDYLTTASGVLDYSGNGYHGTGNNQETADLVSTPVV